MCVYVCAAVYYLRHDLALKLVDGFLFVRFDFTSVFECFLHGYEGCAGFSIGSMSIFGMSSSS